MIAEVLLILACKRAYTSDKANRIGKATQASIIIPGLCCHGNILAVSTAATLRYCRSISNASYATLPTESEKMVFGNVMVFVMS